MKRTALGLALLLAACGGSQDSRVAELEDKVAHLEKVAAAERESYEAQVADLQARNREITASLDRFRESAETAAALVGASGSLEDKITSLNQKAAACEADLQRYREGLDEAVLLLNNMGRRVALQELVSASSPPPAASSGQSRSQPAERPPLVVAHDPYAISTGTGRYAIDGEVRNMDQDRAATGYVEVWISSDGKKVDSTRIDLVVPPLEYVGYTADLKAPPWDGDMARPTTAYAKWVPTP